MPVQAQRSVFGVLPDGRQVEAVALRNEGGMSVRLLAWGATVQAVEVPDRAGASADVVLGYRDAAGYLGDRAYLGATVGRYANRIADGRFALDGATCQLARNDGPNTLHGGAAGFDKRLWTVADVRSGDEATVTFAYVSADGEEGFPGTVHAAATYTLGEANELAIEYGATTDKPTIVNLTGHSYFDLAGEGSGETALGHWLTIPAERFTPVDAALISTGELRPVAGTPFDFRAATEIGARIRDGDEQLRRGRGYDHNWAIAPRPDGQLRLHARLEHRASGRVLEVLSDQPGLQFYSGNSLDGTIVGKSGRVYRQSDGLCLEPQLFPDTPNRPEFGSARLDPGDTYRHRIVYRFSVL